MHLRPSALPRRAQRRSLSLTRSLSTYTLERDTQISLSMVWCEPRDCKSALHPITHILARSTIDQTVINSHLSPTHCFPSCSTGLPPVPASTHGNSFYIKVCSWTWWAHSKTHIYTTIYIHAVAHNGSHVSRLRYSQILQERVIKLNVLRISPLEGQCSP